jgi:hypothetical protein
MSTTDETRAHITRTLDRLRIEYGSYLPLPRCDGLHVPPCEELLTGFCSCEHQDGERLSLLQLRRLYKAIIGEFAE